MKIEDVTESDIGRHVIYTGNRGWGGPDEVGCISSFNDTNIFVRYGFSKQGIACSPSDLEWEQNE